MPGEHAERTLSPIQERILNDLEARIIHESPVPGYVIDSVARIHPVVVADNVDGELKLFRSFDIDDVETMEPQKAWRAVNHLFTPTIVPYKDPVNIYHEPRINPEIAQAVSFIDTIGYLVAQRKGLEVGALFTGPIISEELVSGKEDLISVTDAAQGMLYYHSYSIPEQTLLENVVVGEAPIFDRKGEIIEATGFSPEIIICIPVANGQERNTLPRTLRLLAEQSLDFERYEIVLLHNTKVSKDIYDSLMSGQPDEVAEELVGKQLAEEKIWLKEVYRTLFEEFPGLRLRANLTVHDPYTSIGYCRTRLGEAVASKYIERQSTNNPLVLSLDADVQSLNKDYLANLLATAEQRDAPVVVSRVRWQASEGTKHGPTTAKLLRLSSFMYAVACSFSNMPNLTDSGTAIRLKEYCLAGGHYWADNFSENIHIAQILRGLRGTDTQDQAIAFSHGSIMGSNSRRQLDVLARGHASTKTWNQGVTTFGEIDDPVRIQQSPCHEAEAVASAQIERLIGDMIDDALGGVTSKCFRAKAEIIRKGLAIIGLPDYLPTPDHVLGN